MYLILIRFATDCSSDANLHFGFTCVNIVDPLTLCIQETPKPVLLQAVKTQMK